VSNDTNRGSTELKHHPSGHHRRLKDATATSRRCSTTIAACPRVAIRCGRRFITLIAGPRMGRHRRRGFSSGRFPICLRVCCHRLTSCLCPGNAVRPSRQVIEGAGCPGLNQYPRLRASDGTVHATSPYSFTRRNLVKSFSPDQRSWPSLYAAGQPSI